jgi:hypothetical protein
MSVQFAGKSGTDVVITLVVQSNTGGAVLATFNWDNISDPNNRVTIVKPGNPDSSSSTTIKAADLAAAPKKLYSIEIATVPTDDSMVWAYATQNGVSLMAVDGLGNPLSGEGPHKAVKAAAVAKEKTNYFVVSISM